MAGCETVPAPKKVSVIGSHDGALFNQAGLDYIDEMMETAIAEGRIPSAISMLAHEGEIIWLETAGDMGPGVPMRRDAIIPLASVGKMYTATAAMILIERGVIAFDDPVSKYIPEFADVKIEVTNEADETHLVAPDRPITVRHLLTHATGLNINGNEFWAAWDANVGKTTTTHLARDIAAMPLRSQPGERYYYGPTGAAYEVLGAVIETASGQTLEEFMIDNIFDPLGLEDTVFYMPEDKADRLPAFYRKKDGVLELSRAHGEDFPRSTFFHGGGGVQSAPEDIARFTRMFLEGGVVDGIRILKAETISQMMSDQLGDLAPSRWQTIGLSWGFGAAVRGGGAGDAPGLPDQYGWVGGGYAKLWIDPKKKLVAYIAFPMDPPGDNGLLSEFDQRVNAAMVGSQE